MGNPLESVRGSVPLFVERGLWNVERGTRWSKTSAHSLDPGVTIKVVRWFPLKTTTSISIPTFKASIA
jgi:hypothetical protein